MAVDNKIEWNFNNTYLSLPKIMLSEQKPDIVEKPEVVIINHALSKELGLNLLDLDDEYLASVFSGNLLPCLLYTSPSPRDRTRSRMPSSA